MAANAASRPSSFNTNGLTDGLWYFPPHPPHPPPPPRDEAVVQARRAARQEIRDAGHARASALVRQLQVDGASAADVFEQQAWGGLGVRLMTQQNRCSACWHDRASRCICAAIGRVRLDLPVRVIVLMHHQEYYRASDDAKLLMMMMPPENARLLVFGRPGDMDAFHAEVDEDPTHSLMLWPGEAAQTIEQFLAALPSTSPWRAADAPTASLSRDSPRASTRRPVLRVVVLDAVYRHARTMFRHVVRTRAGVTPLRHVALHPKTLSVYSRAQHGYAQASALSVRQSSDPAAMRICTVEAFALLLTELGEGEAQTKAFVDAVVVNNGALAKGGQAARGVAGNVHLQ